MRAGNCILTGCNRWGGLEQDLAKILPKACVCPFFSLPYSQNQLARVSIVATVQFRPDIGEGAGVVVGVGLVEFSKEFEIVRNR
jgi:hypothetical protein